MEIYSRSIDTAAPNKTRTETVWCCKNWDTSLHTVVRTTIHRDSKPARCSGKLERWTDTGWHRLFSLTATEVHDSADRVNEDELLLRWTLWVKCGKFDAAGAQAAVDAWNNR